MMDHKQRITSFQKILLAMKEKISAGNIQDLIKYNKAEAKAAWEKGLEELGVNKLHFSFLVMILKVRRK